MMSEGHVLVTVTAICELRRDHVIYVCLLQHLIHSAQQLLILVCRLNQLSSLYLVQKTRRQQRAHRLLKRRLSLPKKLDYSSIVTGLYSCQPDGRMNSQGREKRAD
jgi:hypothetical protein